ncbi:MAG: DUF1318 domain-containing protein [Proteobacteria bacterium]|nr:DUF1318 domain-containing protein [Pseudomonadota bacterium]
MTPITTPRWALGSLILMAGLWAGCVKAPDVMLTDQKTALEKQAAGEFRALENDLHQAGIEPKGEDIPREAMEGKDPNMGTSTLGEMVQLYSAVQTDAEWIDQLLVIGCVGESRSGLLLQTPNQCTETVDTAQLTRVVERTNLHRRQLWRLIKERQPQSSDEQIRATWREVHLKRVVCGALIEKEDKSWQQKEC